ncbi:MAG TPA: asparagine synthase-related protein [Rhodocyclaceae bacterium]|nr:asparagine synthase-related protein [Rhodocyclaceae bacterium]HRQ46760.1 asparagine synthase-related protein [Rhodocyclaceae bacterium]
MNPVPGVHLHRSGNVPATDAPIRLPATRRDFTATVTLGDWLSAGVVSRLAPEHAHTQDTDGVAVLFDGYLTDIVGRHQVGRPPASVVLDAYRANGLDCVRDLRGSFTVLVTDPRTEQAFVLTDRSATRPLFHRANADGSLQVAPEVGPLVQSGTAPDPVDPVALCEFLLFGSYFADRTLFPSIRKLPASTVMSISRDGQSVSRYWRIAFTPDPTPRQENELIEEYDALLRQSVTRRMRCCPTPMLFLSGGIDSRLMLGSLLREGHRIPVATYGTEHGDDRSCAASLARKFDLELHQFPLSASLARADMLEISVQSDGRAEMIDTAALVNFVETLATRHGTFFQGDQCFSAKPAADLDEALVKLEMLTLDQAPRLSDWLHPELRRRTTRQLDEGRRALVAEIRQESTYAVRDTLYVEQRLGNRQNGYSAAWLRSMEQARPWIDEDVVDFVSRLPPELRVGKPLLRRLYQERYPDMADIPFAQQDSIPLPRDLQAALRSNGEFARFVRSELCENLDPRLNAIVQSARIGAVLASMTAGRPLPPIASGWRDRIPGVWRLFPHALDAVHPASLLFRLLQIQLYLRALGNPPQRRQELP